MERIENAIQEIDDRVASDIWDAFDQLHELLIKQARRLANSV